MIFRQKSLKRYITIDKFLLEDVGLSWKAKGILAYLLSRPEDWHVCVAHLEKQSTDGKDSIYSGLKELKDKKYIWSRPISGSEPGGTEYWVYDYPHVEDPFTENPVTGKSSTNEYCNVSLQNKESNGSPSDANGSIQQPNKERLRKPHSALSEQIAKRRYEVSRWFNRKATTRWDRAEEAALRRYAEDSTPEDREVLEWWFSQEDHFTKWKAGPKTTIKSFLNAWVSEADKARGVRQRLSQQEEFQIPNIG